VLGGGHVAPVASAGPSKLSTPPGLNVSPALQDIGELSVFVNGERHHLRAPCTVAALLGHLALGTRRVAVAVNRDVVPRSAFAGHTLASGDRVEILEAVGGG
jgi:sulfur carrier protein